MTRYNLIPAVLLILGILLAIQLGNAVERSHRAEVFLATTITTEQFRFRLESCINSRIAVIAQLADPKWADRTDLLNNFSAEASSLFHLFAGFQALNFAGNDGVIERVFPETENVAAFGANLFNHPDPQVVVALTSASMTSRLTRTSVIELLQGGPGLAMYQTIYSTSGEQLGFVNGVFRTGELIDTCLFEQEQQRNFNISLSEIDGGLVYRSAPLSTTNFTGSASTLVDVAGLPWRLDLAPTSEYLLSTNNGIEGYWLYVGIFLVILLSAAIRSLLVKQESLRDSQEKYRLLIENQSDLVVKVNANHEFLYVSPNYCTTFGKSEAAILGNSFMPLVHEEDQLLTQTSLDSISPDNLHSYHEQRAFTKAGWRWIAWSNTGVFDAEGKLQSITAVGRDITDIKKLKEDIAQNQKMQAIGEIASGITHDFNNLLQIMMANIEFLIKDSKYRNSDLGLLEQIQKALLRAQDLIINLSTLSKQDVFVKVKIEINQFVSEVVEMFRQSLPDNIAIAFSPGAGKLYVNIDTTQFERVLLNLFINAKEAINGAGNIIVVIDTRVLDADFCKAHKPLIDAGEYVQITVSDTGCGIPAAELSRVFEPFFSTKTTSKTSGLGLANTYSIVKQLEGIIDVESTPGEGSTFSLFLPLANAAETRASGSATGASNTLRREANLILVVDDEPEILNSTLQILQSNGYQTLSAANGKAALEIYAAHKKSISLVILDLVMPVMSGQQAAVEIRKLSPTAKLLFISGYIPESEGRTIQLSGPLLRKPFRSAALLGKVAEISRQ